VMLERLLLLFFGFVVLLFCFVVSSVSSESVVSLTPENFDDNVGGSRSAFVEFYAPWCGHCKHLAPEYENVGKAFERSKASVLIAKVDCDAHKDLCAKYEVQGYLTLKWFPANTAEPQDYDGERDAEGIVQFINDQTDLSVSLSASGSLPSNVVVLTLENFDQIALDPSKDVLVEFYAPWCGHCKQLAPDWDKLSGIFAPEKDVVIAKVDCTVETDIASRFEIEGYPTLKFFPKGESKTAQEYEEGRSLSDLVSFINQKANKNRLEDGRLNEHAGTIEEFDKLLTDFFSSDSQQGIVDQLKKSAETSAEKTARLYVILGERALKSGKTYIDSEIARLERLIDGGAITLEKRDEFTIRINILKSFLSE